MKVTGKEAGRPPEPPAGPAEGTPAGGPAFADRLADVARDGVAGPAQTGGPDGTQSADLVADIRDDLMAGRIGANAAVDRMVSRIVDRQLGVDAPAALRESLDAVLRQALEDDPLLSDKVRSLKSA